MKVRPLIETIAVSGRFIRDLKDREKVRSIIQDVLDCSNLEFHELHKFEMNVGGNLIFRAKKERMHIVYGVDKKMRIVVFLRAIGSFTQYKGLLEDKKEILRMITRTRSVD